MDDIMTMLTYLMYNLYAIRVDKGEGKEAIRVYTLTGQKLSLILEFYMDEMASKILRLMRSGLSLTVFDIQLLIQLIREKHSSMNIIPYIGDGIGWNFDASGNIAGYVGSETVNASGDEVITDPDKPTLGKKGTLDEWVKGTSRFIKDNILLQLLLLFSMASIITGLLGLQTLIVAIIGKAREGKSTAAGFMTSVFTSPSDGQLSLNFNATDYYLMARMNNNTGGGCVSIDDSSLNSRKRNFQDLVYSIASNRSVGRLIKNQCAKVFTWCTSVVMTGEHSFLFNGSGHKDFKAELEGFAARLFEVIINPDSLFTSASDANEMQEFCKNQYGTASMAIVKYILKNRLAGSIRLQYKKELERIRAQMESDPVMNSVSEQVATIGITAKIAEAALGLKFDIEGIEKYMLEVYRANLEEYRAMQNENTTVSNVYPELVKLGIEQYAQYSKGGDICIPAAEFTEHVLKMKFIPNEVKKDLFNAGLLVRKVGFTYTINHNGEPLKVVRLKNIIGNTGMEAG